MREGDRGRGLRLLAEDQRARTEADEYNRLVIQAGQASDAPEPHRLLARWCMAHGRFPRAALEWQEVLSRLPADPEALRGLAAARHARDSAPSPNV